MKRILNKAVNRLSILIVMTMLILPDAALAGQDSTPSVISEIQAGGNPLLQSYNTPGQTLPFDQIKPEHFMPALQYALAQEKAEVEAITSNVEEPTFANTVEALERSHELAAGISDILTALNDADTDPALQKIATDASVLLAVHDNDIYFNQPLFTRIELVYNQADRSRLSPEQQMLLENTYKSFIRNGVNLSPSQQARLRQIDSSLAALCSTYSQNLLANINDYYVLIKQEDELSGLPEYLVQTAARAASDRGLEGWYFKINAPTYFDFMTFADNPTIRQEMYQKYRSVGMSPQKDNREIVKEIADLRLEKANIMGYDNYADYVLEDRMAQNSTNVRNFINVLLEASLPAAQSEVAELQQYAQGQGMQGDLQECDYTYYEHKLKQEKYFFDEQALRPYFPLEQVQSTIFELAHRLYGISFVPSKDIPVYQNDVQVYEVFDEKQQFLGVIYLDFFCRDGKGNGAWALTLRKQVKNDSENIRPLVNLVFNFPSPTESTPALLSFSEVATFLHEFGHGMHFLFSDVSYRSLNPENAYVDFVEVPSMLMENWAYEKEFLHLCARHYQNGEALPDDMVTKIQKSRTLRNAYDFVDQLRYATLDMSWYTIAKPLNISSDEFELQALHDISLLPPVPETLISPQISHIFVGGYDAGYYSYKWAEALEADIFMIFKQHGIMNRQTGEEFRQKVLARGASVPPMELFKSFVGREPSNHALLQREGFIH